MAKDWTPCDAIGNKLHKDDYVSYFPGVPIIGRIVAVEEGGMYTPQGQAPTRVRVVIDVTLTTGPGAPIGILAKVCNPISEAIVDHAMNKLVQD